MRNKLIRRRLSAIVVVAWLISFESTLRAVAVTPRTQVVPHPISSIPQVQSASNTSLAIEAADSVGPISPILETPTAVDPWVAFEEEYKPSKRISWQAGRWLQSAKYRLDTAAFLIKESAKKLQFRYDFGGSFANDQYDPPASQQFSTPLLSLPPGHLESIVTVHDPQTGEAFIGLELVIEIGRAR
jgi:hypothetical protein